MSDLIERQAVLAGLANIAKAKAKARSEAQKSLMGMTMFFVEQLPSVTPKHCEDAISKQAAVDAVRLGQSYISVIDPFGTVVNPFVRENNALEAAVDRITALPSVTPTPKNVNDVLDEIKADLQILADDEWNQQVMASKGLEFAIEIIENYQMAMKEGVEE